MILDSELNVQQREVLDESTKWGKTDNKQTYEISGPAGSGKTTIVRKLVQRLGYNPDDVMYIAYVGKAAMMLSLNGNNGRTIHSAIYEVAMVPRLDENGNMMTKLGRPVLMRAFRKKDSLPPNIRLLVVDEGSMVNKAIGEDILSFGLPVVVLGDLNQLPPVFGSPYFLIQPDYVLTMIERQVAGHPVIKLSQMAMRGERIPYGDYGHGCHVLDKSKLQESDMRKLLMETDITICGRNETRQGINDYYRKQIRGIKTNMPVIGDKLICRQNNWRTFIGEGIFLINGLVGYVEKIYLDSYKKDKINIDFRPEFLQESFININLDHKYLAKNLTEPDIGMSYNNKFQFANAISAHLSQGSQYPSVLAFNERMGSYSYYNKWRYTVYTRARQQLTILD